MDKVMFPKPTRPTTPAPEPKPEDWADAVAIRLSSEWSRTTDNPELEELLHTVIFEAFRERPDLTMQLVGTFVVEESYFEGLDDEQ